MIVLSKNEVTCLGNTFDEKQQKLYIFENLCKNRNIIVQIFFVLFRYQCYIVLFRYQTSFVLFRFITKS